MPVYQIDGLTPVVPDESYVHPTAVLIGDVILGKGVYVLEHSYRVARGGTYETGLATVECAYAPEYASHSAGGTVVIK